MKKQADGRYKSKVVVGKKTDGSNIVKWISGRTKKELEAKRQRVIEEYRDGASSKREVQAVDWINEYYDAVIAPGQKPTTAKDIRSQIRRYIVPVLKDKQLRAVTSLDLQKVINGTKGRCRTLVGNVQSVLKRSFSAAYAEGLIERDVSASLRAALPPRKPTEALSIVSRENVSQRLTEPFTEAVLLGLLFYTGMRRGEICGLQWRDVDFERNVIHVRRDLDFKLRSVDRLKTVNAERDIPLVPELKAILMRHRGIGTVFVISGEQITESGYNAKIDRICAELGFKATARNFRKTFNTMLLDGGVPVIVAAKLMGHADANTTFKYYTDLERSKLVEDAVSSVTGAFEKK